MPEFLAQILAHKGASIAGIVVLGTLVLVGTSGRVVQGLLAWVSKKEAHRDQQRDQQASDGTEKSRTERGFHKQLQPQIDQRTRDVGMLVGKCENLLVVAFTLVGAYTALGLIFAAKTLVRREDMRRNSLYFLAGTLINFTYSVLLALIMRILIHHFRN